jgi:phosphoribosylformimino-5-aminoimidazole carboxamide ribotide isomerase
MSETGDFTIIPAVDIKGGKCVRLLRGMADEETVFSDDPVAAALRWQSEGARFLHVVDLDGAFAGEPVNDAAVMAIAAAVDIPVEVGGGIRNTEVAAGYIDAGVSRVIIGTAAFKDPGWLAELVGLLGERLVVGLDVKTGNIALQGWMCSSYEAPAAAVQRLTSAGVSRIIYTDIMRDGTLEGPNFEGLEGIAKASEIPVIASGGVARVDDLLRIAAMSDLGVEGAIVGMALYQGKFSLAEAQEAVDGRGV